MCVCVYAYERYGSVLRRLLAAFFRTRLLGSGEFVQLNVRADDTTLRLSVELPQTIIACGGVAEYKAKNLAAFVYRTWHGSWRAASLAHRSLGAALALAQVYQKPIMPSLLAAARNARLGSGRQISDLECDDLGRGVNAALSQSGVVDRTVLQKVLGARVILSRPSGALT